MREVCRDVQTKPILLLYNETDSERKVNTADNARLDMISDNARLDMISVKGLWKSCEKTFFT